MSRSWLGKFKRPALILRLWLSLSSSTHSHTEAEHFFYVGGNVTFIYQACWEQLTAARWEVKESVAWTKSAGTVSAALKVMLAAAAGYSLAAPAGSCRGVQGHRLASVMGDGESQNNESFRGAWWRRHLIKSSRRAEAIFDSLWVDNGHEPVAPRIHLCPLWCHLEPLNIMVCSPETS